MNFHQISDRFVEYYKDLGYILLPKAPMLHPSIPMSFVMSAGLVQVETSLANAKERKGDKYVLVQDCFRHFDLDKVGTDNTHLSMFQMPGAFIFGDKDRKETIKRMWELATQILGIDKDRIWVSYFKGGEWEGHQLAKDEKTYQAWLDMGIPKDRLIGLGVEDNYWIQGGALKHNDSPFRKLGPNTELFYDRYPNQTTKPNSETGFDKQRFVEFSNSLFISHQFDPTTNKLFSMEDPFTETVIGSERVAMILQGVDSVYDTDVYLPIMNRIEKFIKTDTLQDVKTASKRIIADYLRGLFILVADGAPEPGKDGRRRIIKLLIRGVIANQILLNIKSNGYNPIESLIELIDKNFTEDDKIKIEKTKSKLLDYFAKEQKRFYKTLNRGYKQLDKMLNNKNNGHITGEKIVYLEKQFGFPHILTYDRLRSKALYTPDEREYEEALRKWKNLLTKR